MEAGVGRRQNVSIWWFAFGYFAAYVPYSSLTKYLSGTQGVSGNVLLPATALASLVGMYVFISAMGWWKHATHRTVLGLRIPVPGPWTLLSGLCTAAIIPTTTLAYTFDGISILFMMLLMRGGVLIIAPVVDVFAGRHVNWYSWAALAMALGALGLSFAMDHQLSGAAAVHITLAALLNLAIYLGAYFVRLRFMSRLAKSDDGNARLRYFVEEQMVATPALVLTLAAMALLGGEGALSRDLAAGFTTFWSSEFLPVALVIGVMSQGTGIFGGLILLDKRENTYCVPVNRASSILAGLVASYGLWLFLGNKAPGISELVGAGMIIGALLLLSLPPLLEKRSAARLLAQATVAAGSDAGSVSGHARPVASRAISGEAAGPPPR